jgi:hypothetical protein
MRPRRSDKATWWQDQEALTSNILKPSDLVMPSGLFRRKNQISWMIKKMVVS